MEESAVIIVDIDDAGKRIDAFVAEKIGLTRSAVARLIENEDISVCDKAVAKNYKLRAGDVIEIDIPEPVSDKAEPENIPLDVLYEDEDIIVVNKPSGMVVHPAAGNPDQTLVNALLYHCKGRLSSINGVIRPGIVHRIDKDTSGLLIVAKTDEAHQGLAEQIAVHSFERKYEAIVGGHLREAEGTVNAPIGRHKTDRKKMAVTEHNSKEATTHWRVIAESKDYSHLELTLETGRTHQIRVHMAHIGHPVAGDTVYGNVRYRLGMEGQCLFAKYISFVHPITGETMTFEAARPTYFSDALRRAGL